VGSFEHRTPQSKLQFQNQAVGSTGFATEAFQNTLNFNMSVLWDVAVCTLVETYRRFRCTYCSHDLGDRPKDRLVSTRLQGASSQKILNFILAAVRT
jgi:hypothetical protein